MAKKTRSKKKVSPRKKPSKNAKQGIVHLDKSLALSDSHEARFDRADLVFTGVDHSQTSYEVRVFLNNKGADDKTARSAENGYAGRFVVFGHGGCYGDAGHCDVVPSPNAELDRHRVHPVTPQTRVITITKALQRVLSTPGQRLRTITLVPISQDAKRANRKLTPSLFQYTDVKLQTYR